MYIGHDSESSPEHKIEKLKKSLTEYTLDPSFESYGNFIIDHPARHNGLPCVSFFGNFFDLSLVFRIDTNDAILIKELTRLIRANQSTQAYKKAKNERTGQDENYKKSLAGF
jgi:hypothetical protein